MTGFGAALRGRFGQRARADASLAALTTFRVGGAADWLIETRSADEIGVALELARRFDQRVTLLGGGSNVLVSDQGVRGLVIRPRHGEIVRLDPRHIRADAAVTINWLVRWTIGHGCAGLEVWAGTPGTVGGALFGNAHFGGRLMSEVVSGARLISRDGAVRDVSCSDLDFAYDHSRLQRTGEVLLWAVFVVSEGDPAMLRARARESLGYRKRTQPLDASSAGCIFRNPEPGLDVVPEGLPWSAGALIDRAGLKGAVAGGAQVSPVHGNFIVNVGGATARDIRVLIERCRRDVRDRLGVELREEIVYLGDFD